MLDGAEVGQLRQPVEGQVALVGEVGGAVTVGVGAEDREQAIGHGQHHGVDVGKRFGHVDAGATVPAEADTIYDVASVGKQFTAAAVMRLVEQGRLSLDARVREIIPELPANFPDATVDQLLRHVSGFVEAEFDELDPPAYAAHKRYGVELLSDPGLRGGRALFEPGETWVYCNPGYLVLGIVIERASGERYDGFVRDELLAPIGLAAIRVCERAEFPRMSPALHRTAEGAREVPFIDMTHYGGQGSICSSAPDLLRWSHALNTGRIVCAESLALMRSHSVVTGRHDDALVPYGMGQRLGELVGHRRVGHSGTFEGGSSVLMHYADDRLDIAVIVNTAGSGVPHALSLETLIAKAIFAIRDPDVRSLEVPLSDDAKARIRGVYSNGDRLEARFENNDLLVFRGGEQIERLVHVGGLRFRNLETPDAFEWFVPDGDRAGWWMYSLSGNFLDVLRRE